MNSANKLPYPSGPDEAVTLTDREHEVLRLLAQGFSAKQIALRLAITARTVETHIDRLRLKTHTRNRTHMVVRAIEQGLL